MPNAATMNPSNQAGAMSAENGGGAPVPVVPFIRSSRLYRERFADVSRTQGSSDVDLGTFNVPAYGYMRSIVIHVQATGGSGSGAALEDAPWTALQSLVLTEPNGAIINQFNTGFDLYLANKYGGYRFGSNPNYNPVYSIDSSGVNYEFLLRIPVEISFRDGLGAFPTKTAPPLSRFMLSFRATIS